MARPARARMVGGEAERRRVVSAISEACSRERSERVVWAKVAGEREGGGLGRLGGIVGRGGGVVVVVLVAVEFVILIWIGLG